MSVAEKSNAELKERVKTEEQSRKSAEAALKGAETQAESQRKLVAEVKGQLVTAKEQIATLRQQLEEANQLKALAEKARVQAKDMTSAWLRPKTLFGPRSLQSAAPTAPKLGKRLSTRLGLRPHQG